MAETYLKIIFVYKQYTEMADSHEFIDEEKFTYYTSTFLNVSLRSGFGLTHEAIASQKKMKSRTTPLGLMLIIWHTPLNDESFSSLSRILRREVHLKMHKKIR